MKMTSNTKSIIYKSICLFAIITGGGQYTFAASSIASGKKAATAEINSVEFYELSRTGRKLSASQATKLEKQFSKDPDNLRTAVKLLGYYQPRSFRDTTIKNKREKIILGLIKKHPESSILRNPEGQLYPYTGNCPEAVKLWKNQIKKNPKNLEILWNAASNLFLLDKRLVEKILKKGKSLDPKNPRWPKKLGHLYSLPRSKRQHEAFKEYKLAYEIGGEYSSSMLPQLAKTAIKAGEYKEAEKYGKKMLAITQEGKKRGWNYGNLIYDGNMILGITELKKGNIDKACEYLLKSGKTPGSPQLNSFGPNMTLAKKLLAKGQKECVIKFLLSCSKFWKVKNITGRDKCAEWIKEIKAGSTPNFGSNLYY